MKNKYFHYKTKDWFLHEAFGLFDGEHFYSYSIYFLLKKNLNTLYQKKKIKGKGIHW